MSPTLTTSLDWDTIPSARTVIHQHKGSPPRRRHNLFAGCSTVGRLGIPVNRHGQGTPRPPDSGPIIESWTGGRKVPIASVRQATSPLIAYQLDQSERLQGREVLFIRLIRISNCMGMDPINLPYLFLSKRSVLSLSHFTLQNSVRRGLILPRNHHQACQWEDDADLSVVKFIDK
jgi:hypothetical protein